MFPATLTYVCFQLIYAIDEGKILSLKELEHELDYKNNLFEFLNDKFPNIFDFSLLNQIDVEFLVDNYQDIWLAHGPQKFGVEKNGLVALLAYTIELIQRERSQLTAKGHGFQLDINPNKFSGRNDNMV